MKSRSIVKLTFASLLCAVATLAQAETPRQIMDGYVAEAQRQQLGYMPSAPRGAGFFRQAFVGNADLPSCTTCHTDSPEREGRHAITGKAIKPLAVAANAERFTDPARVEKWFGRNCREVVGRNCTAAEKGDLLAYLSGGR